MLPVEQPFKTYTGLDGKPLDSGYIYIGAPGQDPIMHPLSVFWDPEGTIPAEQPLRTLNGYIARAGTPANVYFDGEYSIVVQDKKFQTVFSQTAFKPERPVQIETQTAGAGQTVFTLKKIAYTPGVGSLHVYVDGFRMSPADYVETARDTVTFVRGLAAGQDVLFEAGSGVNSQSTNDPAMIPYTATGGGVTNVDAQLRGDRIPAPSRRGFWTDQGAGANVHRFRDRVFIGDGVDHTGNVAAPYGNTWLAQKVATWPEKNAQAIILSSEEKIGLLVGARATSAGGSSTISLAAFSYNERPGGTARAMYADVTHTGTAGASYGLEVAVNNTATDVQANAYSLTGGAIGLHLTPEGGSNYTLGDDATPAQVATAPGTVAINVGAGSGGTANKRWNLGIRFGSNALTGSDGTAGTAIAIGMAKGHTIEWRASNGVTGANIRSDVTAIAGQDVGLLFENNAVSVKGAGLGPTISKFNAIANGVNYLGITNAVTANYPSLKPEGADTNIGIFIDSKGNAPLRLRTNGGLSEQLRISHVASAVNFVNVTGGVVGSPPQLAAAGQDSDIDLLLSPKGTGMVKFGTWAASADVAITGYVLIKDATGTQRRLAVIG